MKDAPLAKLKQEQANAFGCFGEEVAGLAELFTLFILLN